MFRRLKRLTAVAGIGALAVAGAAVPTYASAPEWSDGPSVGAGYTGNHGVILGPNKQKYMCAADGDALSASAPTVSSANMSEAKEVSSLRVATYVAHYYGRLGASRSYEIKDAKVLGRMAWIASTANTTDNIEAAASQVAIIRAAGTFQHSLYELKEQGQFSQHDNNPQLDTAIEKSKAIAAKAGEQAGPYTVAPKLELAKTGQEGSVTNIGATSQSGKWMAGYSYTLELNGPAVFESNQSKTITGTTAQSAQNVKIKTTGAGEVSVKLVVKDLPTAKPWISSGTVVSNGKSIRGQNLVVLGKKASVEGTAKITKEQTEFTPSISTQVKAKKVAKGSGLVDTVTAKADNWAKIPGTDKFVPVKATVDVYGPFPSPSPQTKDGKAFANKKIGSYDLTFNGPGTLDTADTVKATSEGFYFFQARVEKAAQGQYKEYVKDYTSPFFEASETSVAQWTPSIKTKASQVDLGNGKAGVQDLVTVSGFPQDHGNFQGSGEWKADTKTISHSIYFFPEGTKITEGATKNMKPLGTVETPAKNGTYTIDAKQFVVDWNLGVGTYVIVSNYQGDTRSSAIRTSELDTNEHVKPTFGKVTTVASTENGGKQLVAGDKIRDNVKLEGSFPAGSYTEVKLYSWAKGQAPKCESAIWTSKRIEHSGAAGEYKTDLYTTDSNSQADYGFVETTYDKNGHVLAAGKCGESSETLTAGAKPGKPTTPAPTPTPTPGAKTPPSKPSKPELANTGAAVLGLGLLAGGLVAAGFGAMAVVRRRRKDV